MAQWRGKPVIEVLDWYPSDGPRTELVEGGEARDGGLRAHGHDIVPVEELTLSSSCSASLPVLWRKFALNPL